MKKGQKAMYILCTLLAVVLFAGRIILTRLRQDSGLVRLFQPQILQSLLYFFYVLVLYRILLLKTARPCFVFSILLLLPLAMDAWYLFCPALYAELPALGEVPIVQLNLYLKCLLALIGFFVGLKARKHPIAD